MKRWVAVAGLVITLAGCGGAGGSGPVEVTAGTTPPGVPASTTAPVVTQPPAVETTEAKTTRPTAQTSETFTMPKVVGKSLQDAQDLLQSRGSYLMDQVDASGEHRIQVLDANWKVCTQLPKAGRKVPVSTVVRLAAVKLDEKCP